MPFSRYADFSGRSRRMEYWMFRLFEFLVFVGGFFFIAFLGGLMRGAGGEQAGGIVGGIGMLALGLFLLGSIIPSIAVTVRRLHDTNRSGWMLLLGFIPLIGGIVLLVFMFSEGTRGPNDYGNDPKAVDHGGDVFA